MDHQVTIANTFMTLCPIGIAQGGRQYRYRQHRRKIAEVAARHWPQTRQNTPLGLIPGPGLPTEGLRKIIMVRKMGKPTFLEHRSMIRTRALIQTSKISMRSGKDTI